MTVLPCPPVSYTQLKRKVVFSVSVPPLMPSLSMVSSPVRLTRLSSTRLQQPHSQAMPPAAEYSIVLRRSVTWDVLVPCSCSERPKGCAACEIRLFSKRSCEHHAHARPGPSEKRISLSTKLAAVAMRVSAPRPIQIGGIAISYAPPGRSGLCSPWSAALAAMP